MTNVSDAAFERLQKIESEITDALGGNPNEADTRFKALNRILVEVMGWEYESIYTEPPTESGFIDYLVRTSSGRNLFVIEAKKAGLLAPETKSNHKMTIALDGPVAKPMKDGIRQALSYANEQGVPTAVLTDGLTWLFFRASRTDGRPPLKGKGILFPTWQAVVEYFVPFSELLSPHAILDKRHLAHLNDAEGYVVSEAEQQYTVYPPSEAKMRARDPMASDAAELFAQFFSRLSNDQDKEMLRECFVETAESHKADLELEKIIQNVLNNVSSIATNRGGELQDQIERAIAAQRAETVLLIGNKGSGKSTFIDRFFEHILPQTIRKKCLLARVDLAESTGSQASAIDWCILQLRDTLEKGITSGPAPSYDELQGIFFNEYQRMSKGPLKHLYDSDKNAFKIEFGRHIEKRRETHPDEYVRLLLARAAKNNGLLPCIVFDNTDQFPLEIQDNVYQLAHSLESAAPVFNIVPITDRSVWRLSKAGALQSYTSRSFYLPVPDAKQIISRRVNFIKEKLGGERRATEAYFSRRGFRVQINDIRIMADTVEKVFVENDYVTGLIGRLGNFDIRRMLKLAERIFVSPELKVDDIIKSTFGGPGVTADRLRTHRALIKGEYDRLSEAENDFVTNVFVTDQTKPGSPLLPYYCLWTLRQKLNASKAGESDDRHWLADDLCSYFDQCGVPEDITVRALRRMYKRGLIETLDPNAEDVELSDRVAIKESGIAHLELILGSSVYLEQTALVTGFADQATRDEIKKLTIQPNAQKFTQIRDLFLRYLLKIDAARLDIPSSSSFNSLTDARRSVRARIGEERPMGRKFADKGREHSSYRKRR
ncbi:ATP-binding protein [Brucella anthropi]|uniref:ATP-binding protein n=1 Tax=Brucella anthropi TaxID=529 RepID=UPI00124CCA98|nr:ATP-binding protein [Brucella anthropi]KAB2771852.1 ATP-binding protein [Brucella anthropi]